VVGQLSRHESRHPLAAAAERGHADVVAKLLGLGASANNRGSRKGGYGGYTPLMLAACESQGPQTSLNSVTGGDMSWRTDRWLVGSQDWWHA